MGKMKFVNEVVNQAQDCIESLSELIAIFKSDEAESKDVHPKEPEPEETYSLEGVRAKLAELSRAGFTDEVRKLIKDYKVSRLSEIDPSNFADLMRDAKEIGNV